MARLQWQPVALAGDFSPATAMSNSMQMLNNAAKAANNPRDREIQNASLLQQMISNTGQQIVAGAGMDRADDYMQLQLDKYAYDKEKDAMNAPLDADSLAIAAQVAKNNPAGYATMSPEDRALLNTPAMNIAFKDMLAQNNTMRAEQGKTMQLELNLFDAETNAEVARLKENNEHTTVVDAYIKDRKAQSQGLRDNLLSFTTGATVADNALNNERYNKVLDRTALPTQEDLNRTTFNSKEEFTSTMLPMAEKAARELGVDPRLLVAQAALETGWGKSIGKDGKGSSNNLMGIKSHGWGGDSTEFGTTEVIDGKRVSTKDKFRKYGSFQESFDDYVSFLKSNPRYAEALKSANDPEKFVAELQKAGYATDPDYAKKITSIMNGIGTKQSAEDELAQISREYEEANNNDAIPEEMFTIHNVEAGAQNYADMKAELLSGDTRYAETNRNDTEFKNIKETIKKNKDIDEGTWVALTSEIKSIWPNAKASDILAIADASTTGMWRNSVDKVSVKRAVEAHQNNLRRGVETRKNVAGIDATYNRSKKIFDDAANKLIKNEEIMANPDLSITSRAVYIKESRELQKIMEREGVKLADALNKTNALFDSKLQMQLDTPIITGTGKTTEGKPINKEALDEYNKMLENFGLPVKKKT